MGTKDDLSKTIPKQIATEKQFFILDGKRIIFCPLSFRKLPAGSHRKREAPMIPAPGQDPNIKTAS